MASLYRRKDPTKKKKYLKYYWVKYFIHGQEFRVSTKCTVKFDAERLMNEKYVPMEVNAFNQRNVLPVKKTLLECLAEFNDSVLTEPHDVIKGKTKATLNRQQTNLKNFRAYVEEKGLTYFSDITEEVINDYIGNHLKGKHKKQPNTVYKDVQIAKNFFQWAAKQFYCPTDPTVKIRNPKPPPRTEPWFYSKEQVEKVFANAKEPYLSMFKLLYLTGLRIQELLNVEWQDISFERKTIEIPIKEGNKAKRLTKVSLNPTAIEVLSRLEKAKGGNSFLFTNQIGNQFSQGKISSYAVRLYKKLEIPTIDPLHTWRHTCASHLVQKGVSLYIVKDVLRHKSIRETEIYSHTKQEDVQRAVDVLTV